MIARPLARAERLAPARAMLLVGGLLLVSWVGVYVTGGTRNALPHLFYLPIVVGAVHFRVRGGLITAVAATVLCGPLMPLDVASGTVQPVGNWAVRGVFFVAVGGIVGAAVRTVAEALVGRLASRIEEELHVDVAPIDNDAVAVRVRQMVAAGRFTPVFQPIFELADGRVTSVEALTRFHDDGPAQPPGVWFTQAAQAGVGVELELSTAEAALSQTRELPEPVALSLNASPRLVGDERLLRLLDRFPDRRVVLEITEHAVVDDYDRLHRALAVLRRRRVKIAVDDAGAGFASLRHIVRLTPDIIKLDVSLTQHVRDDPVRRALARALVQFATDTDTVLIAEGIETEVDLHTWVQLGAGCGQGYLLARPAPAPATVDPSPYLLRHRSRLTRRKDAALTRAIGLVR